jgi:CHAD domain-containing protein
MKKRYNINTSVSLKENLITVIPKMYDEFISYAEIVKNFPKRKTELHEMRKAGKPLRYAMELGEYCFNSEFSSALNDIKFSLDLMGDIHDIDVIIPILLNHLYEIRQFNKLLTDKEQMLSTKQIRDYILHLRNERNLLFSKLCSLLSKWQECDFRFKLIMMMK